MSSINKVSIDGGTTLYDIEDTVGRQLLDDTVGWTGKNEQQLDNYTSKTGVDIANNGFINTSTDSATTFDFTLWCKRADTTNISIISQNYSSTGHKELRVSIPKDTAMITIGHHADGSSVYLAVRMPFDGSVGDYIVSFDLDGYNPSVVGGLVVKNLKLVHITVDEQKADNSVIAPVENGTTIQNPSGYAVGSHAIRNGVFITWKNAKAQGETINDASDYTSGDVASELDAKSYSTTGLSYSKCSYVAGGYVKIGNLVVVNLRVETDSSGDNFTVNGLPSYSNKTVGGVSIVAPNVLNMSDNSDVNYYSQITGAGLLTVNGSIVANKKYAISGTYLCD